MYESDDDKVMSDHRERSYMALVDDYKSRLSELGEWFGLNIRGQEVPSPEVVAPPLGYVPGPDLIEQVRAMVRTELSRQAEEAELESFEDADDFAEDDDDPWSPYEENFDPPLPVEPSIRGGGGAEPPSGNQAGSEASPRELQPSSADAPVPAAK